MKLRHSLGALGAGLVLFACVGNDANVGSDSNKHVTTDGGGASTGSGGDTSGGDTGSGDATHSTGGTVASAGGATHSSGGVTVGSGGASHGTGGTTPASGGATHGTGGTQSTGGSTGGIACGKNTCAAGQYCCNASCGMCAPMGAACIQTACVPEPTPDAGRICVDIVACIKGTVWSTSQCKCVPAGTGGTCATDADCHLVSNYCGGCNCLALAAGEKEPACTGQTVQCLIDPCSTKSAVCFGGHCNAQ